jgi:hypothetical protein
VFQDSITRSERVASHCADLLRIQKRGKQLKPVLRNMVTESKIDSDVIFYIQDVDDRLDGCMDVRDIAPSCSSVHSFCMLHRVACGIDLRPRALRVLSPDAVSVDLLYAAPSLCLHH